MLLGIKNYFIVIFGEKDSNRISQMVKRIQERGKCVQIMDRTYSVIIEDNNVVQTTELRKYISGDENYLVLIIRLNSETIAAWCLKTQYSEHLKSVFNEIKDR